MLLVVDQLAEQREETDHPPEYFILKPALQMLYHLLLSAKS